MNAVGYRLLSWLSFWMFRRKVLREAGPGHGGVCAEIGVWKGDFSRRILDFLRPKELHLIDPWSFSPDFPQRWYGGAFARSQVDMDAIHRAVQDRFRTEPAVRVHRGSSMELSATFPDGYFDWIYIDGDHSRQAVFDDLRAWHKKVRAGGLLVLDDYHWRDESGQRSVKAAIEDFLALTQVKQARLHAGQFVIELHQ